VYLLLECNKILGVRLSVKEHHKGSWWWCIISNGIKSSWRFLQTTLTSCKFASQNTSLIYVLQTRAVGWTVSSDGIGRRRGKIHSIANSKSLNNKHNINATAVFRLYFMCEVHRVSKNVPPLTCYNLDTHDSITIIFGTSVTKKVGN